MLALGVLFLCLVYAGLIFFLYLGAQRLYRKNPHDISSGSPFLSVVVPLRNEEKSARQTLEALTLQNYRGKWEVICVDDRSEDSTADIIAEFCDKHKNFTGLKIPSDAQKVPSPKKRALALGFKNARGDILLTTDADCIPPENWLDSMAKSFTESIGVVQGPKEVYGPNNIITRYQQLEVFGYVTIEATTFAMGMPLIASAPSLAYRKSIYERVDGFSGLEHLVSGDDDMLVHKMRLQADSKVRYNLDPSAMVATPAVQNWKSLISQRARWSSNGTKYQSKIYVLFLFCIFLFYVWLCLSSLFVLSGSLPPSYALLPWVAKYLQSYLLLTQTAKKFNRLHLIRDIWWVEALHVPITVTAVLLGQLKLFRWKE